MPCAPFPAGEGAPLYAPGGDRQAGGAHAYSRLYNKAPRDFPLR